DFLGRDTQDYLLEYVVAKEHEFKESTITNPKTGEDFIDVKSRSSKILSRIPEIKILISEKNSRSH
ncbi:hypothetical protein, partial [Elstera litoralis]|uniref:hypothetical protein n=1 Tax=Elstera litoralis TaxID=552518 RepID=UPI001E53C21A